MNSILSKLERIVEVNSKTHLPTLMIQYVCYVLRRNYSEEGALTLLRLKYAPQEMGVSIEGL